MDTAPDPAAETPEASAAATLASVAHAATAAPTIPNPLPPGYNKVRAVDLLEGAALIMRTSSRISLSVPTVRPRCAEQFLLRDGFRELFPVFWD